VGVSVHLGASLADLHHLLRLCVPHVFPDRVLALEVGSCILTETVSDQLRHGGLWVVGTTVGEIVAGKSVLLGLNNAEFDPRVVVTAVCTSSGCCGSACLQTHHVKGLEVAGVVNKLVRLLVIAPALSY